MTLVLERAEVVLPLGSLVDRAEERARLDKEIAEAEQSLQRLQAKLDNPGFRDKAPADVVAREAERHRETLARLAGLRERRAALA